MISNTIKKQIHSQSWCNPSNGLQMVFKWPNGGHFIYHRLNLKYHMVSKTNYVGMISNTIKMQFHSQSWYNRSILQYQWALYDHMAAILKNGGHFVYHRSNLRYYMVSKTNYVWFQKQLRINSTHKCDLTHLMVFKWSQMS